MIQGIIFDWAGTLSQGSRNLFPHSERVLIELRKRGYKLGLVSLAGHGNEKRWEDLRETGVIKYFDSIKVESTKTAEIYLECIKELGLTTETTVIVDDRVLRGISIGKKLSCQTYWIQTGPYSHELPTKETGEPTKRINSVEDLLIIF